MNRFLKVTDLQGNKHAINVNHIVEIMSSDNSCLIRLSNSETVNTSEDLDSIVARTVE